MSKQKDRTKNIISFCVKENFLANKWMYILFLIVCVLCLILGFIVGFGRAGDFSLSDLPDGTLIGFITKKISGATLFFSRFFSFLGLVLLIWLLCSKLYLCWITFLVVAYQSFLLAINSSILIAIYKFGGVISVLLVYFPLKLLLICALILWSVTCFCHVLRYKNVGVSVFSTTFLKQTKIRLIIVIIIGFCACLLESLLLPCVTNAIFIGVS